MGDGINVDDTNISIFNITDTWVSKGSGWVIDEVVGHFIDVAVLRPPRGLSYIEDEHLFMTRQCYLINFVE